METINRPKGLANKFFILVVLTSACMSICHQFFNSSNALHVTYLNGSAMQRGLMLAALPIAALLTRIFAGRLIELHSRRSLCLFGLSFMLLMTLGYALVQNLNILIILRFLQGVGFSITQTCGSVMITDLVDRKRLGEGLSIYQLLIQLQSAIVPSITVYFTDRYLFQPLFFVAALFLVVSIVCMFLNTYEKKFPGIVSPPTTTASLEDDPDSGYNKNKPLTKIWLFIEKRALPCMGLYVLFGVGQSCIVNYLLLYAKEINIAQAGLFFTLQTIAMILARAVTSKSIDRYGSYAVFAPGCICALISFVLLAFSNSLPILYYIAAPFLGVGVGIVSPALNTAAVRSCPESRRSIAASTYMLSADIGIGIGGFIWSFVISFSGFKAMFLGASGFFLLCFLCATYYFKVKMRNVKL